VSAPAVPRVSTPPAFLLVRLGALGDIVHAVPVAAALRAAHPDARIDWLVDLRHQHLLDFVPALTTRVAVDTRRVAGPAGLAHVVSALRRARYDAALDLQGLLKSAVLARLSGASRVIGFARPHLREPAAAFFYSETVDPAAARHVVARGLALAAGLGIDPAAAPAFPIVVPGSAAPARARDALGLGTSEPFVALNPGAAWVNKRWPADRFGALAEALQQATGLRSVVLWGPGEEALAKAVCDASASAAVPAPPTTLDDLLALVASARLLVAGDTGPLHLAAAAGTPVVGLYGPTDPARNGPWSPDDVTVSRSALCECSHQRRCQASRWCLLDIGVQEVVQAALHRLESGASTGVRAGSGPPPARPGHTP
jgi:lipopolysaccharide heptosyltransferase I